MPNDKEIVEKHYIWIMKIYGAIKSDQEVRAWKKVIIEFFNKHMKPFLKQQLYKDIYTVVKKYRNGMQRSESKKLLG